MAMNDRSIILERLQSANESRSRTAHPGPAAPPAAGNLNGKARLDRFIAEAEKQYASIADISSLDDLPAHVSGWLRNQNLPQQCVIAPILEDLGWQETKDGSVEVRSGAARTSDMVGVSLALGAAAETGTVLMVADGATPTSLNFVPDVEIIVVSKKDIEAGMEGCWQKLREWKKRTGKMPRVANYITGPSRTADVEATMVLGAHGPRRLHLVLVDEQAPWPENR